MLDDLQKIHLGDPQDALGIAAKQWEQLEYVFDVTQPPLNVTNIVYAGMGGSALAAAMSLSWPGYQVPFEIVRQYKVPAYVSDKTYFIASSNSGNTEETISALADAEAKGAQIAIITSGGKLQQIAQTKGYPCAVLPGGLQPRHAVLYNLKALVTLLEAAGLVESDAEATLLQASGLVREHIAQWLPTVPTKDNLAKQIALECMGKSLVVYAGPAMAPVAYKWKINFNENAKHIAWWNQYSELNHNEFIGWTEQPEQKPYAVIELRSNLEHPQIQKRFELTARLLSGKRPAPIVVAALGDTLLEQMLSTTALGDFVSLYLAILGGINPTPVELMERLKRELAA